MLEGVCNLITFIDSSLSNASGLVFLQLGSLFLSDALGSKI